MIDRSTNSLPSDLSKFVEQVCQRGSNIGADGVIILDMNYDRYDCKWTYFNSDGGMARMCGNGLRCTAKYIYDNTNKKENLNLITAQGIISKASQNNKGHIHASLPMPKLNNINENLRGLIENIIDKDLNQSKQIDNIYRVDVSVPHLVIFIKNLDSLNNLYVNQIGKIVNDLYTDMDVNVNFVTIDDTKFYIRTYERGVFSETLACGTGCCAFAYILNKYFNLNKILIEVRSKDKVKIFFENDEIFLEGEAKKVYKGVIDLSSL